MSSLYMGCVSYSRQFFSDGVIDAHQMKQAELAARREIEVIAKQYRKTGWKEAYGSSGTAKALFAILTEGGMSDRGITRAGLSKLKDRIVRAGRVVPSELPGIKVERADVLPGGLAIMSALFDELGIEVMHTGDGALRLGVLYDLLGRDVEHDKRDESVRQFMKRYHVDANQARRVHHAALSLFDAMMPEGAERAELRTALGWAADLHEVGLSIAHNAYHKHTAYVLENADMPGFARRPATAGAAGAGPPGQAEQAGAAGAQPRPMDRHPQPAPGRAVVPPPRRDRAAAADRVGARRLHRCAREQGMAGPAPAQRFHAARRGSRMVQGGLFVPGAGVLTATAPGFALPTPRSWGRFFSILEREGSGEPGTTGQPMKTSVLARHAGFSSSGSKGDKSVCLSRRRNS